MRLTHLLRQLFEIAAIFAIVGGSIAIGVYGG